MWLLHRHPKASDYCTFSIFKVENTFGSCLYSIRNTDVALCRGWTTYCCASLNTRITKKKLTTEAPQNRDFVIDAYLLKKLLFSIATWRFISCVDSGRYCSLPCYRYSLTSTLSSGVHVRSPKWQCQRFLQLYVHFLSPCPTWFAAYIYLCVRGHAHTPNVMLPHHHNWLLQFKNF